ncbi:uncharacterized protein LOC134229181 [Saccostrea cucullata]|uniref:uncharacterized protein LOC134229181 n=1 Tax=Saccostrea cuccullata TaxID=36930 RepID=UPI002ED24F06
MKLSFFLLLSIAFLLKVKGERLPQGQDNALEVGQVKKSEVKNQGGIHDTELNRVKNEQKLSKDGVASVTKSPKRRKRKRRRNTGGANVAIPKINIPNAGGLVAKPEVKDPVFNVQDIVKKAKEDSAKETTKDRGVPQVKMVQDAVHPKNIGGIPVQVFTPEAKNVPQGEVNNQNVGVGNLVNVGGQAAKQNDGLQKQDSQHDQNVQESKNSNWNQVAGNVPGANQNSFDQVANNLNKVQQNIQNGNVESFNQNQQHVETYNNNNNINNNNANNNFNVNNNNNYNNANNNFNNFNNVQQPVNVGNQQGSSSMRDSLKIVWDWSDFLINYEQYVMPEQKNRRAPQATAGEPWPMPQYYVAKANKVYKIDKDKFRFNIVKESCDIIERAVERYREMIIEDTITEMYNNLQHAQGTSIRDVNLKYNDDIYIRASSISVVNVKIRRPCTKFPNDQMDESYDVFVKKTGSYIWANEVWGALRGLETFSQLVFRGTDNVLYIKDTVINDYPRFPHRGLLVDSSRHFIFKEVIYDILEGLAQNKMNVMHWHIVDDQSFPYQSKTFPELSEKGAYHPSFTYTPEDIADIIEYARMRGIRVMPEFDTPGHTYSWGLSHPELLTQCYQGAHPVSGYLGPLDPSKNNTYRFLKTFFKEVLHTFPEQYIHLGGDEVPMTCWSSNPEVLKLLNQLNGKPNEPINLQNVDPYMYSYDIRKVLEFYEQRLTQDLKDIGRNRKNGIRMVMWQEIMNNNIQLPNDTIIQIWQGDMGDVQRAIDMGYNALYSTCWYLDLIEYGTKWPKYYNCDPADTSMGYQIDEKKVLGGEAALWAEYIDNENLMTTLWPRASAAKFYREIYGAKRPRCGIIPSRGLAVGQISGPDYCLRRGHRRDGNRAHNCTGDRCNLVQIEKFNFHVQQRGRSMAECNQMLAKGGSVVTALLLILVLGAVIFSLKMSGTKIVQLKVCRNRSIFLSFILLIVIYFMCYTSLWMQVQEFKGSFEKRIKSSYSDHKYS